jgi:class 3 adenylate cyclase
VLFADIKDSTELIKDLDPEAAQQLLDPALHHMMDAVHHFEGTVNQVLGDGIMALFGGPLPMKTTPSGRVMPRSPCRRPFAGTVRRSAAPMASRCRSASG